MNDTSLKSSKFYEKKKEQDDAWQKVQDKHLQELDAIAAVEAAEKKKRDQVIFLGFFSIGLIATLLISGAF